MVKKKALWCEGFLYPPRSSRRKWGFVGVQRRDGKSQILLTRLEKHAMQNRSVEVICLVGTYKGNAISERMADG